MDRRPAHPFRLRPPGDGLGPPGPLDLVIGGSAFGAGTHPTTARCLSALAALGSLDGRAVLDLGCGSGVLGLAALRLGAARATCADVNPDAAASARANGAANGLSERLEVRLGSAELLAGRSFDLVVANIGGELLLDRSAEVAALVGPGGWLLLSGLLEAWAGELGLAYARQGLAPQGGWADGGFSTLLARRAPAAGDGRRPASG